MTVEVPLVLEIQKHPCLYNFNLPEYNRKDLLDAAWNEVADHVNLTVNECKDKWKNIRSSFVRSLKYTGKKMKKPYYLKNYLKFIVPFLKPTTNIEVNPEDSQSPDEGSTDNTTDEVAEPMIKLEPEEFDTQQAFDVLNSVSDNATGEISVTNIKLESFDALNSVSDIVKPATLENRDRYNARKRRRQAIALKNYTEYQKNKNKRNLPAIAPARTENSAMKFFLLSLLPEFHSMDEEQVRLFKIKVMMLIDKIKSDSSRSKKELRTLSECERLQKRLINLLLKNLENKK